MGFSKNSFNQSCEEMVFTEDIGEIIGFGQYSSWEILQCLGCDSVCFKETNFDSEHDYPDEYGNFIPDITTNIYPKLIKGRKHLINWDLRGIIPIHIETIYDETFTSLGNKQPILSGIGIRALVESVCKEKNAVGGNLRDKIDNLVDSGLLSRINADTLQKLRIMGNQSAHEVKPHSEKSLLVAFDIVEHLLREVYILPKQVQQHL
jgi:Domain of unknown function (DUF4145)